MMHNDILYPKGQLMNSYWANQLVPPLVCGGIEQQVLDCSFSSSKNCLWSLCNQEDIIH